MPARKPLALIASIIVATSACAYAHALDPPVPGSPTASTQHVSARRIQHGNISWYGRGFAGHRTASGERFDPRSLTMAHRSLPLGTIVLVINDDNGRRVALRVNDRGPFRHDRVADVSRAASLRLGFEDAGVTRATLRVLWVPTRPFDEARDGGLAATS